MTNPTKIIVDTAFLEKILSEPVASFRLSAGSKIGDNVAGSLQSIKVTLKSGKILNLINKTLPEDDPEMLDYALRFGIFQTEITMYDIIIPRVEILMKSKGFEVQFPIPKFISGNHDQNKGDLYICLQDVRPDGFIMPDKFLGLGLPEVTLVMKNLANFHASTYFWIKYEGEKVFNDDSGLIKVRDSAYSTEDMAEVGKLMFSFELENSVKLLQHRKLNDFAEKVKTKLIDTGRETSYNLFRKINKKTDNSWFPCIIHGDLWVNNIMIKYDGPGSPVDLKFLDFQQVRRGNIFEDLIYFIMTSTSPEFRKKNLVHMLEVYHNSFVSTLEQIKCPIPIGFTRGRIIDTFYENILGGYVYMVFAIPLQLADQIDPTVKKAAQKAQQQQQQQNGNGEEPSPPDFDPSKMSIEDMMAMMSKNLETRSQMFLGQMLKSPRAIDRLVDLTNEMVEMKLL